MSQPEQQPRVRSSPDWHTAALDEFYDGLSTATLSAISTEQPNNCLDTEEPLPLRNSSITVDRLLWMQSLDTCANTAVHIST
jgi:hypothetical protein